MDREGAPRWWWDNKWFLLAISLAMAIPFITPPVPPLVDMPGHMGRYRILLDIGTSPALQSFYYYHWQLIGNLGLDLLVIPLAPIFGLELAVKLIVMSIVVLTATGLFWISREVHGHITPTVFFALPLAFGHPLHFGFVNFALSMALALNAFALWLRLGRLGRTELRRRLFIFIGFALWVCHTFGWATLCVLAFSAEVVRNHDKEGGWHQPFVHAALSCLPLAPPFILMVVWRNGHVGGETGEFFRWDSKWRWIMMTLRDRWLEFDKGSVAVLGLVLIWAAFSKTVQFSRMLRITALFLLLAFALLPRVVFGSAYADMRLTPFLFAIALIAIRPNPGVAPRTLLPVALAALAFFGVRLAATTVSFHMYGERAEKALGALEHVPQGARLVSFVGRPCGLPWYTSRLEHIPAMATVRRHAFTNDQWVMAGAQLLGIKKSDARGFNQDASQLVSLKKCPREVWRTIDGSLRDLPRNAFDYVWLIDPQPYDHSLVSDMTRIWTNGRDELYRIDRDAKTGDKPS